MATPDDSPNPKNISEIKSLIRKHGLEPGSNSQSRKLLEEGFELAMKREEYNEALKEERGIDLNVDSMRGWIDNMIDRQLGGRRRGNKIEWVIDGESIVFDPMSGEITCGR